MMSLTIGLFTQVSGSGPLGPLVIKLSGLALFCDSLQTGKTSAAWALNQKLQYLARLSSDRFTTQSSRLEGY